MASPIPSLPSSHPVADDRFSRRSFLRFTAVGGAFSIVPRHVLGGAGRIAPSEKITLAGIGAGGQGMQNLEALQAFPETQVVAVCDVNREGGRYLSWNWTEGKEEKLCGRGRNSSGTARTSESPTMRRRTSCYTGSIGRVGH